MAINYSNGENIRKNKVIPTFLYTIYKSLKILSPYAKLTSGTMWEWFTKDWVRKENYIQVAKCGTIVKNPKYNMPKLEEHLKLKDEMVRIL
jgi:hypothetical protein